MRTVSVNCAEVERRGQCVIVSLEDGYMSGRAQQGEVDFEGFRFRVSAPRAKPSRCFRRRNVWTAL